MMTTKLKNIGVRFIKPEDKDAIRRVQKAAQHGAVTVVHTPGLERFLALRLKAHAIDASIISITRKKSNS